MFGVSADHHSIQSLKNSLLHVHYRVAFTFLRCPSKVRKCIRFSYNRVHAVKCVLSRVQCIASVWAAAARGRPGQGGDGLGKKRARGRGPEPQIIDDKLYESHNVDVIVHKCTLVPNFSLSFSSTCLYMHFSSYITLTDTRPITTFKNFPSAHSFININLLYCKFPD